MDILLQVWGGGAYLANKILLSRAEGTDNAKLRIWGWILYLIGVPAWVIVLTIDRAWIATTIELGGVPSMALGLYMAVKRAQKIPVLLDRLSMIFAYALLAFGFIYSVVDNAGINSLSQVLEIGVMFGFLGGTYLLAKSNRSGWLLFMLMNVSMGLLMFTQSSYILAVQQFVSLAFVVNGYMRSANQPQEQQPVPEATP